MDMKKLISSISLLLISLIAFSQTYNVFVSGIVTDQSSGLPVANQEIYIWTDSINSGSTGYYNTVYTDANGYYSDSFTEPSNTFGNVDISTYSCGGLITFIYPYSQNMAQVIADLEVCSDTASNCQAYYTYNIISENTIEFIDLSIGDANFWHWDFGDGQYSAEQYPTHSYNGMGTYLVCLTIYDSLSNCESTYCEPINIGNDCEAMFSYYPNGEPTTIQFIDQSIGTIDTWYWDFGDGLYSYEQNPLHNYPNEGEFITKLTISGDSCMSEYEVLVVIPSDTTGACDANFYHQITEDPSTIEFFDSSIGMVVTWSWDFGDGNTSQEQNPIHSYDLPGYYNVFLYIEANNNCTSTIGKTILVSDDSISCEAMFSVELDTLNNTPNTYLFTDISEGDIVGWYWDFGDGTYSMDQNPVHTYNLGGDFMVCLTITSYNSGNSCTSTYCDTITTMDYYSFGGQVFIGNYPINVDSIENSNTATIYLYRKISNSWQYMDEREFWKYGYYWFADKPVGEYLLFTKLNEGSIDYENYTPSYYPNSLSWNEAGVFSLTNDEQFATNINFIELQSYNTGVGQISGNIQLGESCDMVNTIETEGVLVQLFNSAGEIVGFAYSDETGYYNISGIGPGTYGLHAEYPGRYSEQYSLTISDSNLNPVVDPVIQCSHILGLTETELSYDFIITDPWPNPAYSDFTLSINTRFSSTMNISILNINGMIINEETISISNGFKKVTMNTHELNSGYYFIKIYDQQTGYMTTRKLIVIK